MRVVLLLSLLALPVAGDGRLAPLVAVPAVPTEPVKPPAIGAAVAAEKPEPKTAKAATKPKAKAEKSKPEKTKRSGKKGRMVAAGGGETEPVPQPDAVGTFLGKLTQQTKSLLSSATTAPAGAR